MRADDWNVSKLLRQTAHRTPFAVSTPSYKPFPLYITMLDEKGGDVEWSAEAVRQSKPRRLLPYAFRSLLLLAVVATFNWAANKSGDSSHGFWFPNATSELCPQVPAASPEKYADLLGGVEELFDTREFKLQAIESLGGAVRIPYANPSTH